MDGQRFDDLTKRLAAGASRRGVLRGLIGAASGALGVVVGRGAEAARPRPAGATCVRNDQCAAGNCDPATRRCACPGGQVACGGACVDPAAFQTDPRNCGACRTRCPDPANGAATCAGGVCGVACDPGFAFAGGACCPDARVCAGGTVCCAATEVCDATAAACCTPDGGACAVGESCCSGACDQTTGVCGPGPGGLPLGAACVSGDDCDSGTCEPNGCDPNDPATTACVRPTGGACAVPCDCASNSSCTGGVCGGTDGFCDTDPGCVSGNCTDEGICCAAGAVSCGGACCATDQVCSPVTDVCCSPQGVACADDPNCCGVLFCVQGVCQPRT